MYEFESRKPVINQSLVFAVVVMVTAAVGAACLGDEDYTQHSAGLANNQESLDDGHTDRFFYDGNTD